MEIIEVSNLSKTFKVVKRKPGLVAAVKSLFVIQKEEVHAVDNISFSINKGEIVGYIGPNGSGKSTTIKMMSGILKPTSGRVLINGTDPQQDRKKVVGDLGVVFGQRTQLYWDLRLGESFELLKRIYRISDETYESNLKMMDTLLDSVIQGHHIFRISYVMSYSIHNNPHDRLMVTPHNSQLH